MSSRPTSAVGPHLGERITALVDGALADDARDRALLHVSGCDDCRAEFEAARLMKTRLCALPAPVMSSGLTARLLAMAEPGGPIPPRPPRMPGETRVATVPRPSADRPASDRPLSDRPLSQRPPGSRPAGRTQRGAASGGRRTARLAALSGAALSTMVLAVVGLSGAIGSETRTPTPVSQLTTGGGAGPTDPFLQISRTVRQLAPTSTASAKR